MPKPPVKAQGLADRLAALIRSGDLTAGTWLIERQLATTHGVGRSTVRNALGMLARAGLVEQVPDVGAQVAAQTGSTPTSQQPAVDAAAVHSELAAIRTELRQIGDRLSAIEERTGAGEGTEP